MNMRGDCVYLQVLVQMYLRGWDSRKLAEQSGITYTTMRRKLRGMAPLHLEEARRIVPENEFYLRVNLDNPASLHVMLKNGGRIVRQDEHHFFVRIPNPGK